MTTQHDDAPREPAPLYDFLPACVVGWTVIAGLVWLFGNWLTHMEVDHRIPMHASSWGASSWELELRALLAAALILGVLTWPLAWLALRDVDAHPALLRVWRSTTVVALLGIAFLGSVGDVLTVVWFLVALRRARTRFADVGVVVEDAARPAPASALPPEDVATD